MPLIQQFLCITTLPPPCPSIFFFNDTATTEIYTLSLHDALPIYPARQALDLGRGHEHSQARRVPLPVLRAGRHGQLRELDRKSTRLNSSHSQISYAVFCLKKKKKLEQLRYMLYCHRPHHSTHEVR